MKQRTLAAVAHSLDLSDPFPEIPFRLAVTDSRHVEKGDLFFALVGQKTDGHVYLAEIAQRGALAAVVLSTYMGPDYGLFLLKVPNVLVALQTIAKKRIAAWQPKIVAITGSVGKTTTKEFIFTLLATKFSIGKAPGNANSQVGLPLTILNLHGTEEFLVLEMGMTEVGHIAQLVAIAPPTLAVITKIGMAHAGNFVNGIEGVAAAKGEILSNPRTKLAIMGTNVYAFEGVKKASSCTHLVAGYNNREADVEIISEESGYRVREKKTISPLFQLPFSASHFLEDFVLAVTVARAIGLEWVEIFQALPDLQSTGSRFAPLMIDGVLFINDAYNASPESVRAALDNLPTPAADGRRIAVLGGMTIDLGPTSELQHVTIARHALEKADLFFCYGPGSLPMKDIFEKAGRLCVYTEDMDELRNHVFSFVRPRDVVLVKGANRYALWQLFQTDGKIP